jgi:hypothetical protein
MSVNGLNDSQDRHDESDRYRAPSRINEMFSRLSVIISSSIDIIASTGKWAIESG